MSKPKISEMEKPADFSFLNFKILREVKPDLVQTARIGSPSKGETSKYVTRSVWLSNNKLKSINNLDIFIDSILELPSALAWLDLSFNKLEEIDLSILKFPNLRILYLHGNNITDVKEILKLKMLKGLRTLTVHGNPVYAKKHYRSVVIVQIPQIVSLDFTRITNAERESAMAFDRKVE